MSTEASTEHGATEISQQAVGTDSTATEAVPPEASTTVDMPVEETAESSEDTTTEAATDSELPGELYFNGEQVQVEVPDELSTSLKESGVDVNKVLGELYGKDSDFTLSDETRKPLDDKYGKAVVDTFLGALKNQNEGALKGAKDAESAAAQAAQEAEAWSNEVVGGEEEWAAMSKWAETSLDESEIESFNKAMQSGDKWMQELAIKSLHGKYKGSEGDATANLLTADSSTGTSTDNTPMSRQDYLQAMSSPEFMKLGREEKHKAQAALDARRQAGINKGL